jgi:hypothetical protein
MAEIARALVLAVVLLAPLPLGSNRPLFWSAMAAVLAVAVVLTGAAMLARGRGLPAGMAAPAAGFGVVVAWMLLQMSPWLPAALHHPAWAEATAVLGRSLPGSISASRDGTLDALLRWGGFAAVFVVITLTTGTPARARRTLSVLVAGGAAVALGAIAGHAGGWPLPTGAPWAYTDRLTGPFVNPNTFATWLGLVAVAALVGFLRFSTETAMETDRRAAAVGARLLTTAMFAAAAAVVVAALLMTGSRGGIAATVGALLVTLALHVHRQGERSRAAGPVALLLAALAVVALSLLLADYLSGAGGTGDDLVNRMSLWRAALSAVAERPLLGHGAGAYAQVVSAHFETVTGLRTYRQAHNTWLEIVAGLGIPVAAVWVSTLGLVAVRIARAALVRRRYGVPLAGLGAMLLVGLHGLVDFSVQVPAVAILAAAIVAAADAVARNGEGPANDPGPQ